MDVLVTGASGFLGSALLPALTAAGYRPIRAVRSDRVARGVDAIAWDPEGGVLDAASLEGIGAVVHLAGAGIGDRRWSDARKRVILESRTKGTTLLASTLAGLAKKPAVLLSMSAVGYYGNRGDEVLTEDSPPGDDFVAEVCKEWEASTRPAADAGIRVVTPRMGVVLHPSGGVLHRLVLPFRLGLGGRVASGKQWMSWIDRDDAIQAMLFLLTTEEASGAVNVTSPNPVTNAELTRTLGHVVHRPTVIPTPLFPLRAVYGSELVEHLLVEGQRVVPRRLQALGFTFEHADLEDALRTELH